MFEISSQQQVTIHKILQLTWGFALGSTTQGFQNTTILTIIAGKICVLVILESLSHEIYSRDTSKLLS